MNAAHIGGTIPPMLQIIGEDLLARDADGNLRNRIATVFPRNDAIVTLPGIHATQRVAYVDVLNERRAAEGLPPLTEQQEESLWDTAVDLVLDDEFILIRPERSRMELAFEADELLQTLYSKKQIKFLHVLDPKVRAAIQQRGECWRICPLPRSPDDMIRMIECSRIGIGGRAIYYYNHATGTRILTCHEFANLAGLDDLELRKHLEEIRDYAARENRMRKPEISFFMADAAPIRSALEAHDFATLDAMALRDAYASIRRLFQGLVPIEFQRDDPRNPQWRSAMYAALIGQTDKAISEEALLGLSAEFFMQIEWVPGGRLEDGELILDPVFEEEQANAPAADSCAASDPRARELIFNFIRDYSDIEHVNIGRVASTLSQHHAFAGHRRVYLAEIQQRGIAEPVLRIIRMQKRGVWEFLDRGDDMLKAILESEEYTEQILDRRLACRQLGMNLPPHLSARKMCERYAGSNEPYRGQLIWSTYFERDYVKGLATDKVPTARLADDRYAFALARVLGRAAAPNLIVGRCDPAGNVVFDAGDELIVENEHGEPVDIVVTDHTGTFMECHRDLAEMAEAYAAPVKKRAGFLSGAGAFAEVYLQSFAERFSQIQQDYRKRRRAFDLLFKNRQRAEELDLGRQWQCVLKRLDSADPDQVSARIRQTLP